MLWFGLVSPGNCKELGWFPRFLRHGEQPLLSMPLPFFGCYPFLRRLVGIGWFGLVGLPRSNAARCQQTWARCWRSRRGSSTPAQSAEMGGWCAARPAFAFGGGYLCVGCVVFFLGIGPGPRKCGLLDHHQEGLPQRSTLMLGDPSRWVFLRCAWQTFFCFTCFFRLFWFCSFLAGYEKQPVFCKPILFGLWWLHPLSFVGF